MRIIQTALFLLLVGALACCRPSGIENPNITQSELIGHVTVLASDKMQGRAVGTAGFDSAAAYVANQLQRAGVLPGVRKGKDAPSYFQPVPLLRIDTTNQCDLTFATMFDTVRLSTRDHDLMMLHPGSRQGEYTATSPLMDAGHAIRGGGTSNELSGVDVAGRVVLLDLSTPASWRNSLSDSLDALYRNPTTALLTRLENLKDAAVVLIPVLPEKNLLWRRIMISRPLLPVVLEDLTGTDGVASPHPAVFLVDERKIADILARRSRSDPETGLHKGGKIVGVTANALLKIHSEPVESPNVIGFVPGSDPDLAGEVITVTAHLDHMGTHNGLVFHGANDNASGVSVLLEAAEALTAQPVERSVLFIFTAGEELGFYGSTHWILHPTIPLSHVIAEINLDEVGRTPSPQLGIMAIGTHELKEQFTRATESMAGVTISWIPPESFGMLFYRSDQVVFHRAGIPSIFLTTGDFPEYHTPGDTAGLISGREMMNCANILLAFLHVVGDEEASQPHGTD